MADKAQTRTLDGEYLLGLRRHNRHFVLKAPRVPESKALGIGGVIRKSILRVDIKRRRAMRGKDATEPKEMTQSDVDDLEEGLALRLLRRVKLFKQLNKVNGEEAKLKAVEAAAKAKADLERRRQETARRAKLAVEASQRQEAEHRERQERMAMWASSRGQAISPQRTARMSPGSSAAYGRSPMHSPASGSPSILGKRPHSDIAMPPGRRAMGTNGLAPGIGMPPPAGGAGAPGTGPLSIRSPPSQLTMGGMAQPPLQRRSTHPHVSHLQMRGDMGSPRSPRVAGLGGRGLGPGPGTGPGPVAGPGSGSGPGTGPGPGRGVGRMDTALPHGLGPGPGHLSGHLLGHTHMPSPRAGPGAERDVRHHDRDRDRERDRDRGGFYQAPNAPRGVPPSRGTRPPPNPPVRIGSQQHAHPSHSRPPPLGLGSGLGQAPGHGPGPRWQSDDGPVITRGPPPQRGLSGGRGMQQERSPMPPPPRGRPGWDGRR